MEAIDTHSHLHPGRIAGFAATANLRSNGAWGAFSGAGSTWRDKRGRE